MRTKLTVPMAILLSATAIPLSFADSQAPVPQSSANSLPVKYLGNSFSGKFHRPSCPFARAMDARHVMFFNFRREAVENGQSPCRYCLPANWTTVKAVLLNPNSAPPQPIPPPDIHLPFGLPDKHSERRVETLGTGQGRLDPTQ